MKMNVQHHYDDKMQTEDKQSSLTTTGGAWTEFNVRW